MGSKKSNNNNNSVKVMIKDIVLGIELDIKRKLEIQGHGNVFVDQIMDQVDRAVEYAGSLGKLIESDKYKEELRVYENELRLMKNENKSKIKIIKQYEKLYGRLEA